MAETTLIDKSSMRAVKVKKRKARPPPPRHRPCQARSWRDISIQEQTMDEFIRNQLPLFTAKHWLILPSINLGVERYIFLMNLHHIPSILRQIRADTAKIKAHPPTPALFTTPYDITEDMLKYAKNIVIVNNKVRNRMQVLARRWKSRHLKLANTEDLLTGEQPKQCIRLRDYKNRSEYVFEADTIHKDMYERLLQNYYTFPEPQAPRNPYTNELLTFSQFFNVMMQLYRVPGKKIHWALDALFNCSYDLNRFQNVMASKLRQSLIQRIMATPTNETGIEVLADFIEDCFKETTILTSEEVITYRISLYRWAARTMATHPQLCRWRTVCYKHQLQRINAIPPTLEQKTEVNREIGQLIRQTPCLDISTQYDLLQIIPTPVLHNDDPHAWQENFGLNHIFIITSDTAFFEITG